MLHPLDDAFLNRQPVVDIGQHALAAAISLAAAIAAIVFLPRLRPGLRAGISLVFGVFALVNGALHVAHISVDGLRRATTPADTVRADRPARTPGGRR